MLHEEAPSPENLPATQSLQLPFPVAPWKVPAAHGEHDAALAPLYLPSGQAVQLAAPSPEAVPAAHTSQSCCPTDPW